MKDVQSWSAGTIAGVTVSFLCMLPTALTVMIGIGLLVAPSTMAALAATNGVEPGEVAYAGGQTLIIGFFAALAASIPVSVASVVLHPIGAVAAGLAFRAGARRSGAGLLVAHGVTFVVGAMVGLYWLVFFSRMFAD